MQLLIVNLGEMHRLDQYYSIASAALTRSTLAGTGTKIRLVYQSELPYPRAMRLQAILFLSFFPAFSSFGLTSIELIAVQL